MATSGLSLNEQWLWLVEQLTEGSVARTTATLGRRIRGELDLDRLREALTELIRRHETLRTTYVVTDGRLERVIGDDPTPDWLVVDLTDMPEAERESWGLKLMDEQRTHHIDITQGRQTRCWIGRLSPTEHLMLFATHHLAADAASLVLMEEELSGLYRGDGAGDRAPAASSPPYTDFVEGQAEALAGRAGAGVEYWSELIDEARPLDLDAVLGPPLGAPEGGYSMTVVSKGIAEREQVALGPELSERVHELLREQRSSLFMALLAALELTVHLRSGGASFLVRSPSANRGRPGQRTLIGAVETQTFVRADVAPDLRYADLLAQVRAQVLAGLRHQEIPLGVILGAELARRRPASRSVALGGGVVQFGLFAHGRMADWPEGLDVIVCAGSRIGTASDFQVFAMEEGRRLDGAAAAGIVLEANDPGGAYGRDRVQEFLHAYRDVVEAVATSPEVTVAELAARFTWAAAAAAPAPAAAPVAAASTGAAGDVPAAPEPAVAALERALLPLARAACADDALTPHDSLFPVAPRVVPTAVSLVDAATSTGLSVTLHDLLEHPTVADLARSMATRPGPR